MKYPILLLNPCYFFCKWDVLIIRNRQKMYITRGFCKIIVILTHKWLFSIFLHLYLTHQGSIEGYVREKKLLAQSEVIYFQYPALVLIPIFLLPYLLVLQRLLCQISFLMRK